MKKAILVMLSAMALVAFGEVAVTGVTAKQRYPWNGLVDITVTLSGTEEECKDETLTIPIYATNKTTRAELPVRTVMANGVVTGEGNQWTRKLIWNATADVGCAKFGEVELTTGTLVRGGVQLWENGPYWAECNVGASQPEECGYYFWWGDTVGYKRNANNDGWISVGKNNSQLQSEGYIDATGNLVAAHDAATVHLGAPWRMPTEAELSALINNCDTEWTLRNGVPGRLVKGRGAYASKSIFLPAAGIDHDTGLYGLGSYGYYLSSTPWPFNSYYVWILLFGSDSFYRSEHNLDRRRSVRPVRGFAK